jgi:hypothetical protein
LDDGFSQQPRDDTMNAQTTTASTLADSVAASTLDANTRERIVNALTADDVTVAVTVHHNGFVPNSYRYAKTGNCTTTVITATGVSTAPGKYDMKRSGGKGADIVVCIAKVGQKRGRNV